MNKDVLLHINLDPGNVITEWKQIKDHVLNLPLSEVFNDMSRLKMFVENFIEYFKEYGVLKDCSLDEYRAVLYYYAKTNEGNVNSLRGTELNLVVRILSKIRETV